MEKLLVLSVVISVLYIFAKIVEMKYVEKQMKPFKFVLRDSVVVFLSSFVGLFFGFMLQGNVTDFMNVMTNTKSFTPNDTQVFTGEPEF
jgi:hypothetical protein